MFGCGSQCEKCRRWLTFSSDAKKRPNHTRAAIENCDLLSAGDCSASVGADRQFSLRLGKRPLAERADVRVFGNFIQADEVVAKINAGGEVRSKRSHQCTCCQIAASNDTPGERNVVSKSSCNSVCQCRSAGMSSGWSPSPVSNTQINVTFARKIHNAQ